MSWSGLPERIEVKIVPEPNSGCWLWMNKPNKRTGYSRIYWDGTRRDAHRVVYQLLREAIPSPLELDHLCRNRECVNPEHLEVVTSWENNRRGFSVAAVNARKTACKNGHLLEGDNIYKNKKRRHCIQCNRLGNAARQRLKRRAARAQS